MAQIITLADWCPPDIARRVAGWAGSRRIYIDLTDDGKLHCLPNSGTPLNVPLPRGDDLIGRDCAQKIGLLL